MLYVGKLNSNKKNFFFKKIPHLHQAPRVPGWSATLSVKSENLPAPLDLAQGGDADHLFIYFWVFITWQSPAPKCAQINVEGGRNALAADKEHTDAQHTSNPKLASPPCNEGPMFKGRNGAAGPGPRRPLEKYLLISNSRVLQRGETEAPKRELVPERGPRTPVPAAPPGAGGSPTALRTAPGAGGISQPHRVAGGGPLQPPGPGAPSHGRPRRGPAAESRPPPRHPTPRPPRSHGPRGTLTCLAGRESRALRGGRRRSLRGLQPRIQFKLPAAGSGFGFARFRDGPNSPCKPIGRRAWLWTNRLPRPHAAGSDWLFRIDLKIKPSPRGAPGELRGFLLLLLWEGGDHVLLPRLRAPRTCSCRRAAGPARRLGPRGPSPSARRAVLPAGPSRDPLTKTQDSGRRCEVLRAPCVLQPVSFLTIL